MMTEVLQAIATVGFPIVACGCIAIGFYKSTEKFADTVAEINNDHKEEIKELSRAINNNTLVMQKLVDKLGGEE